MGLEALRGFAMPLIALALATVPTAQASGLGAGSTALGGADVLCHPVAPSGTFPYVEVHPECLPAPQQAGAACPFFGLSGTPPAPVVNFDCIGSILDNLPRPSALQCDPFGLSGTPPQLAINWDCLPPLLNLQLLHQG